MDALRILVVDDNVDAADVMKLALDALGYQADVAYSAAEALRKVEALNPDLIFSDIGMPEMSGHEFARALRAMGRRTMLVAVSGWSQARDIAASLDAGFDQHLAKPVAIEKVLEIAGRVASAHQR